MIFFKTGNVNISLVIKALTRKPSAACSATAPYTVWEKNAAAASGIQKTISRTALPACGPIEGRIMRQFAGRWGKSWKSRSGSKVQTAIVHNGGRLFAFLFCRKFGNHQFLNRWQQRSTGMARDLSRMFYSESTTPPAKPVVSKCARFRQKNYKACLVFS